MANQKAQVRSILVALINRSDMSVLVQLRDNKPEISNPNKLALIVGDAEPDEDPLICATRELEEETGYVMRTAHFMGDELVTHKYTAHRYAFAAEYDQVQEVECHEGQSIHFMPIYEALASENLVFDHKPWIQRAVELLNLR